jgi:hypothetical protein
MNSVRDCSENPFSRLAYVRWEKDFNEKPARTPSTIKNSYLMP